MPGIFQGTGSGDMSICRGLIGQNNPPKNHFFPVHFALIFSKYRQSSPDIQQCTLVDFIAEKCQSDVFESFCFSTPLAHHLLTFNGWVVFGVAQKKTSVACGTPPSPLHGGVHQQLYCLVSGLAASPVASLLQGGSGPLRG